MEDTTQINLEEIATIGIEYEIVEIELMKSPTSGIIYKNFDKIIKEYKSESYLDKSIIIEDEKEKGLTKNPVKLHYSYIITATDSPSHFPNDYMLASAGESFSAIDQQFNLISLSRSMFKNSKPLEGSELSLLNEAYSKFFSKSPTRL